MKTTTIHHNNGPVAISRYVARNNSLSWAARGMYLYMCSLPTEEIDSRVLMVQGGLSEIETDSILAELELAGLVDRYK